MNHSPYRPMGLLHFTDKNLDESSTDVCAIKKLKNAGTRAEYPTTILYWDGTEEPAKEPYFTIVERYEAVLAKASPS